MARNRKNHAHALHFGPAMKALVICLLLGASSVGYVLQKNKIVDLGRQIREREIRLEKLKWDNLQRQSQLAQLLSPPTLQERLKRFQLDLALPQPDQRIWLAEPTLNNNTNDVPPLLVWGNGTSQPMLEK